MKKDFSELIKSFLCKKFGPLWIFLIPLQWEKTWIFFVQFSPKIFLALQNFQKTQKDHQNHVSMTERKKSFWEELPQKEGYFHHSKNISSYFMNHHTNSFLLLFIPIMIQPKYSILKKKFIEKNIKKIS